MNLKLMEYLYPKAIENRLGINAALLGHSCVGLGAMLAFSMQICHCTYVYLFPGTIG